VFICAFSVVVYEDGAEGGYTASPFASSIETQLLYCIRYVFQFITSSSLEEGGRGIKVQRKY
jgi:hypothetical protein